MRSTSSDALLVELRQRRFAVTRVGPDELQVEGGTADEVGAPRCAAGIPLHHVTEVEQSLEQAYLELTGTSVEHSGRDALVEAGR